MDKKILALTGIVIIVVMIAAVAIVVSGDDSDDDDGNDIVFTGRLTVYGNANNDDYLNNDDLTLLKEIVSEKNWNRNLYPYADVNCDGVVDQDDIDHLEKLLNKESARMYYRDNTGNQCYVNYPITGTIAVNYVYGLMVTQTLGIYDRVTAVNSQLKTLDEARYPGVSKMKDAGTGQNLDVESVLSTGVSCIIGFNSDSLYQGLRETGKPIDMINLRFNGKSATGQDPVTGVLTASVLLSCEEKGLEFVKYYDDTQAKIKEGIKDLKTNTMAIAYDPTSASSVYIDSTGTSGRVFGDSWTLSQLPLKDVYVGISKAGDGTVLMEDVILKDPDYIFITFSVGTNPSQEDLQKTFEEKAKYFEDTRAYKEKHVIGVSYSTIGTYMGICSLQLLAANMYPDNFDMDEAYASMQQAYDSFTTVSMNVREYPELQIYTMQ